MAGNRRSREPKEVRSRVDNSIAGDDFGTPELRQRMFVDDVRVVTDGDVRKVARTVDVLAAMLRNGTITTDMARAGRRFQGLYQAAQFDSGGGGPGAGVPRDRGRRFGGRGGAGLEVDRALDARRALAGAVAVLGGHGSPGAGAVWFVVGEGMSIRDYAQRTRWGARRGMTEEVVRGVLVAALAVLAAHWRADQGN